MAPGKQTVKNLLGSLPLAPEVDWYLRRRGKKMRGFRLEELDAYIQDWQAQAAESPYRSRAGRKICMLGMLTYWIEHTTLLGLALAGLGHKVSLGFLPYAKWKVPLSSFDLRQFNLYGKHVLGKAEPTLSIVPLLDAPRADKLPPTLAKAVEAVSMRDVQYTLQVEDVDKDGELFKLRQARNLAAARASLRWMEENKPDVVIVPNGLILEFGAVYQTARHLGIPVVSYEFGEQRDRIWFSQDAEVMLQDTDAMWVARRDLPFTEKQLERVKELFAARQGGALWRHFSRVWQEAPPEGAAGARAKLNLDSRPIVLLAANVIGDSLTLGRQVFSRNMTEWLRRTLEFFAVSPEVQFVLRAHPGERYFDGPSVLDVARERYPNLPEHFRLVSATDPINTYDLVALADLGLVYTTTVGMEMAMSGVPVFVVGRTHYRGKGFTHDPDTWETFFDQLALTLNDLPNAKLSEDQVRSAWHYAYRFFFDYPQPFPWHLMHLWKDTEAFPIKRLLTEEGLEKYGDTFCYLVGEPLDWTKV